MVFIDDNIKTKIIGDLNVYTFNGALENFHKEYIEFIVATGEPASRKFLYNKLINHSLKYTSIIDPGVILSRFSLVEKGVIIHTGAAMTCNVHIGKGCLINKHVVIGHDVTIGEYSVVSPNCFD